MPVEYPQETPSQTAGPYVHIGCMPNHLGISGIYPEDLGTTLCGAGAKGTRIALTGRVFDGTGTPIRDAMVELWQADARGLFNSPVETRGTADPAFAGWGRQPTDAETGLFRFDTIKPGPVPWTDGRMGAPHVMLWIAARGINLALHTRLYFPDEDNSADPALLTIEHEVRRQTLIAEKIDGGYHLDIHLQGERETVFFDV